MDLDVEVKIIEKEFKLSDSLSWCEESNISIVNYKTLHSENAFGRAIIHGFKFKFLSEEDAIAFKLRWI